MNHAAYDLINSNTKVIDIAFKYQFESPEVFCKIFQQYYQMSPRQFRKVKPAFEEYTKADLNKTILRKGGICMLDPKFVTMEGFYLVGKMISGKEDIGAFWQRCIAENLFGNIFYIK